MQMGGKARRGQGQLGGQNFGYKKRKKKGEARALHVFAFQTFQIDGQQMVWFGVFL